MRAPRDRSPKGGTGRRGVLAAPAFLLAGGAAVAQGVRASHRVGVLGSGPLPSDAMDALRAGLGRLGFVEGRNIVLDVRALHEPVAQDTQTAADLAGSDVDVIVVWGTPAALAARRATSEIPIVMVSVGDPIGTGLIDSLAKPGKNVTGLANLGRDISAKQAELFVELVPGLKRVGVVQNRLNSSNVLQSREAQQALRDFGQEVHVVEASATAEYEQALRTLAERQVGGVFLVPDPSAIANRAMIAEQALARRLPTMFQRRENVVAGGLLSYGADLLDQFRQAADYVGRLLKGAKPADLPVQQPTKIGLAINLRTAKALGLSVPQVLLQRADELIE